MWATIPSRSRAGRSGWGSSGSRCSSTASTTCGSSSTTTCASCDSSHDDAHATGLGRTEPRRAFLRPPTKCAGPAAPVTMKIPYKWLQELVGLRLSPAEAADRLTNAGIEVAAVTPLAPDVRGAVVGVARELAALTGARLRAPKIALKEAGPPARTLVRVRIEAPDLCHRFTARVITGVTVGPSPAWLQARLRAVGLRPISNVVDVTNYVLWELGHPLHAFDYDTVTDATIVVRRARAGESFTTLDGQAHALDDSMLVIAELRCAIWIAGVMGGANTEVTDRTTRVLLESAWFSPVSIRRTARTLGLKTDAAYRFERGADIEALVDASARAAALIAELTRGVVARGLVDAYPRRRPPRRISLRMARVERVLGVVPPRAKARAILAGLGLPTRPKGRDLEVDVPSFRRDLALEDDLVEELIRVWGDRKSTRLNSSHQIISY